MKPAKFTIYLLQEIGSSNMKEIKSNVDNLAKYIFLSERKKVTMYCTQCYTLLYNVIYYYKLFPSLGNSSWLISYLNMACSGTELLSLDYLIPHITYYLLGNSNICYCEKMHQTSKNAFLKAPGFIWYDYCEFVLAITRLIWYIPTILCVCCPSDSVRLLQK